MAIQKSSGIDLLHHEYDELGRLLNVHPLEFLFCCASRNHVNKQQDEILPSIMNEQHH
jgi:hypothetical protein